MDKYLELQAAVQPQSPEPPIIGFARQAILLAATTRLEFCAAQCIPLSGLQRLNVATAP